MTPAAPGSIRVPGDTRRQRRANPGGRLRVARRPTPARRAAAGGRVRLAGRRTRATTRLLRRQRPGCQAATPATTRRFRRLRLAPPLRAASGWTRGRAPCRRFTWRPAGTPCARQPSAPRRRRLMIHRTPHHLQLIRHSTPLAIHPPLSITCNVSPSPLRSPITAHCVSPPQPSKPTGPQASRHCREQVGSRPAPGRQQAGSRPAPGRIHAGRWVGPGRRQGGEGCPPKQK